MHRTLDVNPLHTRQTPASFVMDVEPYGMHSFSPAFGTLPDNNGVYGLIRFCGTFATTLEAEQFATSAITEHEDVTSEPFLVTDVGHYKPLSRNRQYTGKPLEVSTENPEEAIKSADLTAGVSAMTIQGTMRPTAPHPQPTTRHDTDQLARDMPDVKGDVPAVAGTTGHFFDAPPGLRIFEDKDVIEAKDKRMGTRFERQRDFSKQQKELQRLLTIEPASEIDEFSNQMSTELTVLSETTTGKTFRYERHVTLLRLFERYKLARTRRAVAISRLLKMDGVISHASEAAAFAEQLVCKMHDGRPELRTKWMACYMSALKQSGLILKDSDPYCLLRYITKREWDEAPLLWQNELMHHKEQAQATEYQGVIQTHETLLSGEHDASDSE